MANLFSGLETLGLSNMEGVNLFDQKKENETAKTVSAIKPQTPQVSEADLIFDATFKCPVCDNMIQSKCMKTGKTKFLSWDYDLRPKYQGIDPLKYDAVVCPNCGYASLASTFKNGLMSTQLRAIKDNISINFKGIPKPVSIYSYDDAILRHKLALACSVIKRGKASERAYICLKMAWLLRGKAETMPVTETDRLEKVKDLHFEELEFVKNAYDGFMEAFSKESFPLYGMSDTTVTYILAISAYRLEKYEDALKLVSRVIVSHDAKDWMKDKARSLKDKIKAKCQTDTPDAQAPQ